MKRYILVTKTQSRYDTFYRYHYKLFDNYLDLQKHLLKFWYIGNNDYTVFEETDIKKDYSLNEKKKIF